MLLVIDNGRQQRMRVKSIKVKSTENVAIIIYTIYGIFYLRNILFNCHYFLENSCFAILTALTVPIDNEANTANDDIAK